MKIFTSLSRQQREAVGLLQVGTFLEYFDLMLYVHMAVLLNELFFPQTDPHTASLLAALAFCSTFVLRPFGALIFGYIGDTFGRKMTVILTTMMMSISCIIMANLPTYAEIGISAAWIMTICRIFQGMSSMGEVIGAQLYVSELVKPPAQYIAVSLISIATIVGGIAALGIATLVTTKGFNWRVGFWIGAVIAVIGFAARTRLRETPDFVDAKKRLKHAIEESKREGMEKVSHLLIKSKQPWKEKINKKAAIAFFLISCGWPLSFYLGYIFFNPLLKSKFGYSAEDIIKHNLYLSIMPLISCSIWTALSTRIHPLVILSVRSKVLLLFTLFLPFFIESATSSMHVFFIQVFILIVSMTGIPADSVYISHFAVLKRFTTVSFIYALSRAVMYVMTSVSLVYLSDLLGYYGLLVIMIPIIVAHLWGVNYFEKLEKLPAL